MNEYPNARDCEHGHQRGHCVHCDLADALAELATTRAALQWYADPFNYRDGRPGLIAASGQAYYGHWATDLGACARAALKGCRGME